MNDQDQKPNRNIVIFKAETMALPQSVLDQLDENSRYLCQYDITTDQFALRKIEVSKEVIRTNLP